SFDRLDAKVNLNGPLIPGKLNARLSVGTQNRDGFMKILDYDSGREIDQLGNKDRWGARLQFDWIVTDDLSVLFTFETAEHDEKATARTATQLAATAVHRAYNTVLQVDPFWGPNLLT